MSAAGLQQIPTGVAPFTADALPYRKARFAALAAALPLVPTALLLGSPIAAVLITGGIAALAAATLLLGSSTEPRQALILAAADGIVVTLLALFAGGALVLLLAVVLLQFAWLLDDRRNTLL